MPLLPVYLVKFGQSESNNTCMILVSFILIRIDLTMIFKVVFFMEKISGMHELIDFM